MFFDKLRSIIRLNLRFTVIAEVKRTELDLFESLLTYTNTDFRFVLNSSLRKVVLLCRIDTQGSPKIVKPD